MQNISRSKSFVQFVLIMQFCSIFSIENQTCSRKIQKQSSRRLSIFLRKFVASCPCTQDQTSAPGQLLWRFLSTSVTPWLNLAVLLNKAVKFPGYFKSSQLLNSVSKTGQCTAALSLVIIMYADKKLEVFFSGFC